MHFKYSPSAAKRWLTCPGSLHLPGPDYTESSEYADEGTDAHDLCAKAINGEDVYELTDDEELAEAVAAYVDAIQVIRNQYEVIVEHTETTKASAVIESMGGTSDHVMMYRDGENIVLHIFDYKHGVGVGVPVVENEQLLSYMSIWRSHYGKENIDLFRATIVQPRHFIEGEVIRNWECNNDRVDAFEQQVRETVVKTTLVAGDHCRWCPKCLNCPVLIQRSSELADADFSDVQDNAEKLVELYRLAPAIRTFLSRIEPALIGMFRKGNPVPGFHVKEVQSKRKWKYSDDELLQKLQELGFDENDCTTRKIKSPAQIEKGKKKNEKQLITELTERKVTGVKLVAHDGISDDLCPDLEDL